MPSSRGSVIFMDSTLPSAKKSMPYKVFRSASLTIPVSGFGIRNAKQKNKKRKKKKKRKAAFCFELSLHVFS